MYIGAVVLLKSILVLQSNFLCILRVYFSFIIAVLWADGFYWAIYWYLGFFPSLSGECILYPSMHRRSPNYYLQYEFHHCNVSQSCSSIRSLQSSSYLLKSSVTQSNWESLGFSPSLTDLLLFINSSCNTNPLVKLLRGKGIFKDKQLYS